MKHLVAALIALTLGLAGTATVAHAKSSRTTNYTYKQVWPTAIRLLRVDRGLTVIEKDAEAGYVLFEMTENNKTFRGALELVRVQASSGRPQIRVVVRIKDRPSYLEVAILQHLKRKLREEYGPEPPYTPAEKKPK